MSYQIRRGAVGSLLLACLLCAGSARHPDWGQFPPGWPGFAYNSQHWSQPKVATQSLSRIKWSTPMDLAPGGGAHYGTPMVTRNNTVVFPVRTSGSDTFRIEGRQASDGATIWTQNTGYSPPPAGWVVSCGSTLTPVGGVAIPDSGGRVLLRKSADAANSPTQELVFYGAANYAANPSAYDSGVKINTPITADRAGNLYFGFLVQGATPINLTSGIARISSSGVGSWVPSATAANDPAADRLPMNCAPALSLDGTSLYFPMQGGTSWMVCVDSTTLAFQHRGHMIDPWSGADSYLIDYSTASPTIGPDGQVFCGVFESGIGYNDRGWMLHFNADLSQRLVPGGFGWDNTVSIIPAASVPLYSGPSAYLLLSKYNNYAGLGTGDGHNKVAVLDPGQSQIDPISGVTIMLEVLTQLGPTPDPSGGPGAVREWCINNAAVDAMGHAGMMNNEDGKLYRWDFNTNTLSQNITLTGGTSEAYTPTVIGPDGTVYAINAATLFAVGQ
jgi:hypothetical protein